MTVKRISNDKEKNLRKDINSLKNKTANQLNSSEKDAILVYLAKKFGIIKQ